MHVSDLLKENIEHGDLMFQFKLYDHKKINPLIDLYAHWHEEVEIIYISKGPFVLLINGIEHIAQTGDCFIINSQDLHQAYHYNQSDSLHYALVFNLDLLKSFQFDSCQYKYLDPILKGTMLFPKHIDSKTETGTLIKCYLETIRTFYQHQPFGWELGIKANLLQILVTLICANEMLITEKESRAVQIHKLDMVKESLQYIHSQYKEKLLISDIAKSLHISTEYYSRIFKLYTRKKPIEYINDYRIEQAAKLLLSSSDSILDISLECGFDNVSYFIRQFKSKKGLTPKQYRLFNISKSNFA